MTDHDPSKCTRVPHTERYSNKNWSAAFRCASCGRQKRYSLNFLGRHSVFCDGRKFTRQ